jgi:hypothetical protein
LAGLAWFHSSSNNKVSIDPQTELPRSVYSTLPDKPSPLVSTPGQEPPPAASAIPNEESSRSQDLAAPRPEAPLSTTVPAEIAATPVPVSQEMHFAAHHKGRSGCDGDLVLTDVSLRFDCPSHPDRGLNFQRNNVMADDDGVVLAVSGKKYHFKIKDIDKKEVRAMFDKWATRGLAAVQPLAAQ